MNIVQEESFGVVPVYKNSRGIYQFCVVQLAAGHWGFPKGHREGAETGRQAALRELFEETGVSSIDILPNTSFSEEYSFIKDGVQYNKKVTYYLGVVDPLNIRDLHIAGGEIIGKEWLPYEDVIKKLSFPESKEIALKAHDYLVRNI